MPLVEPDAGLTVGHMQPGVVAVAGTEPAVAVVIETLELGLELRSTDADDAAAAVGVRTVVAIRQLTRMTFDRWDHALKTLVLVRLAVGVEPSHLAAFVVPGSLRCQSKGGDLVPRHIERMRRLGVCTLAADDSLAYCNVGGLSCEPGERLGLMVTLLVR